jgi:hypothetical protein
LLQTAAAALAAAHTNAVVFQLQDARDMALKVRHLSNQQAHAAALLLHLCAKVSRGMLPGVVQHISPDPHCRACCSKTSGAKLSQSANGFSQLSSCLAITRLLHAAPVGGPWRCSLPKPTTIMAVALISLLRRCCQLGLHCLQPDVGLIC